MKKIIAIIITCAICLYTFPTYSAGFGTYSKGYRMGMLNKFSIKGIVFKSGEGELLLGADSSLAYIKMQDADGNTERVCINPWRFSSTDKSVQKKLKNKVGEYVVLTYQQARIKNPNVDTDYEIVEVTPILSPLTKTCVSKKYIKGRKSEGIRVGRLVKASNKGHIAKSYELILQEGNAGNKFKHMSISKDKELFECAVSFLKAGQKVKIYYNESFINLNVLSRSTNYDIIKIEPVKGLN